MIKITLGIDGMACPMCEAHMNEAVRKSFPIKKVTSSHKKKSCEIISEKDITREEIESAIKDTGYKITSYDSAPHEKKRFLFFK